VEEGGEAYSRALAIDPSFAGASYNLARALAEAGDYEGSLRILDRLAKRDPGNVRVAPAGPTRSTKRATPRPR
jgi:tetratricopeptide (TPR) repeat protein